MQPPFPPIFSLDHVINGFLQPHKPSECNDLFVTGGEYTTPHLTTISPQIPSPWRSASLLIILLTLCLTFLMAEQYARIWMGNPRLFFGAVSVGNTFAPLSVVILLSELNLWRNIFVLRLGIFIAGGGLLALVFALLMYLFSMAESPLTAGIMAGIIEEPAKVAAALLLAGRQLRNGRILNGMLIGSAIGAGFSLFESMGYTFEALLAPTAEDAAGLHFDNALSTMGLRAMLSMTAGHVTWSAVACGALWFCMQGQSTRKALRSRPFLLTLLFCTLVHGAWDFAVLQEMNLLLMLPLFILITWGALAIVIRTGICQIRDKQLLWYDTYSETAAIFSVCRENGSWTPLFTAAKMQEMFNNNMIRSMQLCRVGDCAIPVPVCHLSFIVDETEELSLWWRLPRCVWYWTACVLGILQLASLFCLFATGATLPFVCFSLSLAGQILLNFCWLSLLWHHMNRRLPYPMQDESGEIGRPRSTAQLWGRMLIPVSHLIWGYHLHADLVRRFNAADFVNAKVPLWIPRLYWGSICMGIVLLSTMAFLHQAAANIWHLLMLFLIFPTLAFFMARVLNCIDQHLKLEEGFTKRNKDRRRRQAS